MPRSTDPLARYQARSPSADEPTRSVSERTLAATENAIAASAAESHSTASSAPPFLRFESLRIGLLTIHIGNIYVAVDVNRDGNRHQRQARRIRDQRLHVHSHGRRQIGLVPYWKPVLAESILWIPLLIGNSAVRETIRQHERLRCRLTGEKASVGAERGRAERARV